MTSVKSQFYTFIGGSAFAAFILFASLMKTASIQASASSTPSSDRRFYIASDIKPDHILYPVKGGWNTFKLSMLAPEERVTYQLEYAMKKADYTDYLLGHQDYSLAVATLLRSHHYLQQAADDVITLQDRKLADQVFQDLELFQERLSSVSGQVSAEHQSILSQLMAENKATQTAVQPLLTSS